MRIYYVYILTNPGKTVLYVGVTNSLRRRLGEHRANRGKSTFAGRYYCHKLIYYEEFGSIRRAIQREKELKGWMRARKEALVAMMNPKWHALNMNFYL